MGAPLMPAPFGTTPDGTPASLYTLVNRNGLTVKVTDYGGIITELHVPDRHGVLADIAHGFDGVAPYCGDVPYFGALIGRYGNRIARGRFELDGRTVQLDVNNGNHHLHGGEQGFHKVLWKVKPFTTAESAGLVLTYFSRDGEQGFPGNLQVEVRYELNNSDELRVQYRATTDQPTPVNLTQHTYFNLAGQGDALGHLLKIHAQRYIPIDAESIPLGELAPVDDTPFDFRTPHVIGERIGADHAQLKNGLGYDHNWVLDKPAPGLLALAATLSEPRFGRVLELYTREPGLQFYSGNFLDGTLDGKGRTYDYRSGICLEPQHFPDSPNNPSYPNTILRPGETYSTESLYRFSTLP
ncbi:MAG: aldose epimerase family protein [Pseudomonadota bacterium]